MATYAIGDVQGCFAELQTLLTQIQFDPEQDTLWFTGDLVNRGPASLEVLRYIKALGNKTKVVLGNHDLHLLALAYGVRQAQAKDFLAPILQAHDREELLTWLRSQPLLHYDKTLGYVMTHAGLAPMWNLDQARQLAHEVESVLHGNTPEHLLQSMFGNEPDLWRNDLTGLARLRCIINYFTRMRFCYPDGRLNLTYKGEIAGKPNELIPWFELPSRLHENVKIIFGHWAALGGKTTQPNIFALDTGCVWGNSLTAMCLQTEKRFSIACK